MDIEKERKAFERLPLAELVRMDRGTVRKILERAEG